MAGERKPIKSTISKSDINSNLKPVFVFFQSKNPYSISDLTQI